MTKGSDSSGPQIMGRFSHDMARWMWHWSGRCAIRIFASGSNRYKDLDALSKIVEVLARKW